ncbi:hypothetical protein ILP97_50600 [Amycolatopsis sp. H6(2020)]|nr:hypothetical protein [Amycolatopsis sp. H6(2020)]
MRLEPDTKPVPGAEPQAREPEPEPAATEVSSPQPERKSIRHRLVGRIKRLLRRT